MRNIMNNKIKFFLALIIILTIRACNDSSVNNPPGTNDDFPNSQGTFWKYMVKDSLSGNTDTLIVTVDGSTTLSNGKEATLWQLAFIDSMDSNYVVIDHDSVRIFEDEEFLTNNIKLIFPLEVGATWKGDYITTDSFYVSGMTQLSTPAGSFNDVFVIERFYGGFNEYRKMTIWYVNKVGIIKLHKRDVTLGYLNEVRELIEYDIK
jgi:hypothetical protein